ncbi:MAG: aminopeptidase P family protein [Ectothiorhodospiraceae bacterium]|nr:aminopeptidase P family protein [Ectothiorhodospiraceae bacterium]MCH8502967.1 Xaa-Pro peptidase family protein [Ectothiorhodospiraceae bacterium]
MDHIGYREALRQTSAGTEAVFPQAEFRRRQHALAEVMRQHGLDALLVTSPADIYYLTGYATFEVSVHAALIFTPGQLVLQVPSIETGPAVACTRCEHILGYRWEKPQDIAAQLVSALGDLGVRTVGIDYWSPSLRAGVVDALRGAMPGCSFTNASGLTGQLRIVKTPLELECLGRSAAITGQALDQAADAVRAGASDADVAAVGMSAMLRAGSEFTSMPAIVTAGRRSAIIHTSHARHPIQPGDPVFMEFGAAWHRYTAPMMRTVIAGRASAAMRRVHAGCESLYRSLIAAMRPGETFDNAAAAAECSLAPLQEEVFFSGVYGYSVGAQFPPSWVEGTGFIARGQQQRFRENMVFHLPLCLRVPGHWGIGFSETVRVTAAGAEPITSNRWELREQGDTSATAES